MKKLITMSASLLALTSGSHAQWTTLNLPNSTAATGLTLSHLDDGRYVYGNGNDFFVQDSFGVAGQTQHAATNPGFGFPSFLDVRSDNSAVTGNGFSSIHSFNAGNTASGLITTNSTSFQDYAAVLRDDNNLYLVGGNGSGGNNALALVDLTAGTGSILIDNVSSFSAGVDLDDSGNLYLASNDGATEGEVRMFSSLQLSGGPINFTEGSFIHDFGEGGDVASIAVDSQGRVFASGFSANGFQAYDPNLNESRRFTPGFDSNNYALETFSNGSADYVAFINPEQPFVDGTAVTYGFANVNAIAVPEPSSAIMFLLGPLLIWGYRRAMLLHLA